jgi:DNA-binding LacI/PurR family transcriptional regulator
MRDVAQKAGVSIKTVSRVVNKQGEISEDTRQNVLKAINELGYRPSKIARALVTRRTDTIGLLIGDISNPYFSEVSRGVLVAAQEHDYDVFLCNTDFPDTVERAVHSLIDHNIDGAIIYPTWDNLEWIQQFANQDLPIVLVNVDLEPRPGLAIILTDIKEGARIAVNHLYNQGHRNIGMIAGAVAPLDKIKRVQGYREALLANGLPFDSDLLILGLPIIDHGLNASKKLLTAHPEVTAIFCYNDLIAFGAMQGCAELGVRVPDECAIVGYDNIQFSAFVNPPLTSIHVDKYEIGAQAANCLLAMLEEPNKIFPQIKVNVSLIERAST